MNYSWGRTLLPYCNQEGGVYGFQSLHTDRLDNVPSHGGGGGGGGGGPSHGGGGGGGYRLPCLTCSRRLTLQATLCLSFFICKCVSNDVLIYNLYNRKN